MLAYAAVPERCTVLYSVPPGPRLALAAGNRTFTADAANGGNYEAAAKSKAANGLAAWDCHVTGLGTTNALERLRTSRSRPTAMLVSEPLRCTGRPGPFSGGQRRCGVV